MLIVCGDNHTGKSTQIPLYLMDAGWTSQGHIIGCTNPSRNACIDLASSLSSDRVGYSVPFQKSATSFTAIKYLTDEVLLQEILLDPILSSYSVVIVDQVQKQTLNTSILLGILKKY